MTSRQRTLRRLALATRFEYPLRWADEQTTLGDYEGRDLTLEVFNIPSERQRAYYRKLRSIRHELREELGKRVTLVFHTPEATVRYYGHLFSALNGAEISGTVTIPLSDGGVGERPVIEGPLRFQLGRAA